MKKTIIGIMLAILSLTFLACTKKINETSSLEKYISTCQTMYYLAQDENMQISITTISQETPFLADGIVGELSIETAITIKPKNPSFLNYEYGYTLIGEKGQISGKLQKNSLGIAFKDSIDDLQSIMPLQKVCIKYNDKEENYLLSNVLENSISYTKALGVAQSHFKDTIEQELNNNTFDREIYIKIINNKNKDTFCYYISFLKSYNDYFSCNISLDGEFISEKLSQTKSPSGA